MIVFAGLAHTANWPKNLHRRLWGPYVCRSEAKTVIIRLETTVQVLDPGAANGRSDHAGDRSRSVTSSFCVRIKRQ